MANYIAPIIIGLLICSSVFSEEQNISSPKFSPEAGISNIEHKHAALETINATGIVSLTSCTVKKDLVVNGSVYLESSKVYGNTVINGSFNAKGSRFQNIDMTGSKLTIENLDASDIVVRKTEDDSAYTIVHIKGTTHIRGNITFEGKGEAIVDKTSSHEGHIIGASKITTQ